MYQPGMDRQLAQIRYNDFLQEAADERAQRRQAAETPRPAARKLAYALTAAAPILLLAAWFLAGH